MYVYKQILLQRGITIPRLLWSRPWHCKSVDVGYVALPTRVMAFIVGTIHEKNDSIIYRIVILPHTDRHTQVDIHIRESLIHRCI